MELPPLSGNIFSKSHKTEQMCRWFCLFLTVFLSIILYQFWYPLRDTEFTYSIVAITVYNPLLLYLFRVITTLGSEGFFLVFLSAIYWSYNKSLGFWGLILMPLAIFVTSEIPKDIIRLPRPDVRGVTVPTYTFPSGHTSGAVSVWGYMAIMLKKRWLWIWSVVIVILVGLSRVTLGYHYPGDVIGGIVTGIIFLAFFLMIGINMIETRMHEKVTFSILILLALVVPIGLSLLPATYAPNLMGYLAGAGAGRLLEKENLNFNPDGQWYQHLAKSLIGMFVIALIILELGAILPPNVHMLTFTIHALSTFWATYLAPLIFVKTGLAGVNSDSILLDN